MNLMDTSSTDEGSSAVTEPGSLAAFTAPTQAEFAMVVGDDPDDAPVDFFNRRFMNWMSFLSSSAKLTDLVIPGSHESASYSMRSWLPGPLPILEDNWSEFLAFASQTQSFNLPGQLLNGIRYLDLRVEQANNGEVIFCHGSSVKLDCQGNVVDPVIKNELTPFISAFGVPDSGLSADLRLFGRPRDNYYVDTVEHHCLPTAGHLGGACYQVLTPAHIGGDLVERLALHGDV